MKVKDIAIVMNKIAPTRLAQDWDNVGLLVGDENKQVKNILLAIDVTQDVVAEAKKLKTDLIISYHPIIWDGLKKITPTGSSAAVYELIRLGISVYSIHTSLDVISGGVNDGLADMIGLENPRPIGDYVTDNLRNKYKLITFVPCASSAKVANAMFAAGAGAIGNYSNCGFETTGSGTFKPLSGSKPAIGKVGKLTKIDEIRFECIVEQPKLQAVIAAMTASHPYEMPAFDCIKLYDSNRFGLGRIGKLKSPTKLRDIIVKIKKVTSAKSFGMIGKENRTVKTAAVCAGSCGKLINLVIAAKADLYLTGELKHHQALAAQEAGLTCICLSHTVSERFILKKFAKQLQKQLNSVTIRVSKKDADPFNWKNI